MDATWKKIDLLPWFMLLLGCGQSGSPWFRVGIPEQELLLREVDNDYLDARPEFLLLGNSENQFSASAVRHEIVGAPPRLTGGIDVERSAYGYVSTDVSDSDRPSLSFGEYPLEGGVSGEPIFGGLEQGWLDSSGVDGCGRGVLGLSVRFVGEDSLVSISADVEVGIWSEVEITLPEPALAESLTLLVSTHLEECDDY